jgi:hypothetical protein
VHDTILISGRDSVLVAIPFIFMLFLSVFRFDEALARPRAATASSRQVRGMNEAEVAILRDPDGRLVEPRRPKRDRRLREFGADFHTKVRQFWNK